MLNPSKTYTSPVLDAPGVDPKLFEMPVLSSWEAFILATHKAVPLPPPSVDEFVMCPDLVLDDGSSQRCVPPNRSCCGTRLKLVSLAVAPALPYTLRKPTIILLLLKSTALRSILPPRPPASPHRASWSERSVPEEGQSSRRAADTVAPAVTGFSNALTTLNAIWTLPACGLRASTVGSPPPGGVMVNTATCLRTRTV